VRRAQRAAAFVVLFCLIGGAWWARASVDRFDHVPVAADHASTAPRASSRASTERHRDTQSLLAIGPVPPSDRPRGAPSLPPASTIEPWYDEAGELHLIAAPRTTLEREVAEARLEVGVLEVELRAARRTGDTALATALELDVERAREEHADLFHRYQAEQTPAYEPPEGI
jgi:hypothetical protein